MGVILLWVFLFQRSLLKQDLSQEYFVSSINVVYIIEYVCYVKRDMRELLIELSLTEAFIASKCHIFVVYI